MAGITASIPEIEELARRCRIEIVKMVHRAQAGHPGGSLSEIDLMAALYSTSLPLLVCRFDCKRLALQCPLLDVQIRACCLGFTVLERDPQLLQAGSTDQAGAQ